MAYPKLSVVIITLNEEQRLPRILGDLAAQSWKDFEVIHVDSNSDDQTVATSKETASLFEEYRIIEMPGRGVSRGRNTGAAAAKAERLLFLDADTRLKPDFLERAIAELEANEIDLGIALMSSEGFSLCYRAGYAAFNAGIRFTSQFFPTAIGACLFSTRKLHEEIGGFDETLSLCEDCNYALKAFKSETVDLAVLKPRFGFDPRRLEQDGFASTGLVYLRANLRRFFIGELHEQEIPYAFGHYAKG